MRCDLGGQRHHHMTGGAAVLVQRLRQTIVEPLRLNLLQLLPPVGGLIGGHRLNGEEKAIVLILLPKG